MLMKTFQFTLSIFVTAVRKEIIQQWRTKRFLAVLAVFLLFGLGSPLISSMVPELVKSEPGGEELVKLLPPPSAADGVASYIEFIGTFGYIMVILLGMNAVAGEKESGTAGLILSKPMPRWAFVLSKFMAQSLVYSLAVVVGALAVYYCTVILFGAMDMLIIIKISLLLLLWLLTYAAVALLGSVIGRTIATAAGAGLGLSVLIMLARNIPHVGKWTPSGLMGWASALMQNVENESANTAALVGSLGLIMIFLIGSVVLFERQEIQ
jgi:ABC-2 type transport system permease protein